MRVVLLCLALVGCTSQQMCLSEGEVDRAKKEIQDALLKWTESFNNNDMEGVMSIFAPNVIASYQGRPDMQYNEIKRTLQQYMDQGDKKFHYDLEIDQIDVSGILAVTWLFWHLDEQEQDKIIKSVDERGIDVWKRQRDGAWKIVRYNMYPMVKN